MSERLSERLELRVSPEWLARLDGARGDVPRGAWIKRALEAALDGRSFVTGTGATTIRIGGEAAAGDPSSVVGPASPRAPKPLKMSKPLKLERRHQPANGPSCPDHPNSGSQESRGSLWCGEPGCPRRLS